MTVWIETSSGNLVNLSKADAITKVLPTAGSADRDLRSINAVFGEVTHRVAHRLPEDLADDLVGALRDVLAGHPPAYLLGDGTEETFCIRWDGEDGLSTFVAVRRGRSIR